MRAGELWDTLRATLQNPSNKSRNAGARTVPTHIFRDRDEHPGR